MPLEVQKYLYRTIFHLSAAELEAEPADQLFMNLQIYALMKKKEQLEVEHG